MTREAGTTRWGRLLSGLLTLLLAFPWEGWESGMLSTSSCVTIPGLLLRESFSSGPQNFCRNPDVTSWFLSESHHVLQCASGSGDEEQDGGEGNGGRSSFAQYLSTVGGHSHWLSEFWDPQEPSTALELTSRAVPPHCQHLLGSGSSIYWPAIVSLSTLNGTDMVPSLVPLILHATLHCCDIKGSAFTFFRYIF